MGDDAQRTPRLWDCRIPFGRGCHVRLIERPGLALDDRRLGDLVAGLRRVADRCVPDEQLRYGVLSGERARLADALLAVAYGGDDGDMIGFSAMVGLEVMVDGRATRVVHAGLAMVDPDFRSRGICAALSAAPALLAFLRNRLASLWFTNVTQVPAVAGVFTTALADVYPTPDRRTRPPTAHAAVVAEVMSHHRAVFGVGEEADFDADAFLIRNAYTGGSDALKKRHAECTQHRDARFNAWLRDALDYDRGDDVIQIGRMSVAQWGRLLLRMLPRPHRAREVPRVRRPSAPRPLAAPAGATS